ncbi:MAG: hypothetical protein JOY69_01610 [Candidatus Eremiobacteraeota bacterium]|nr:hypothetical protein [Candidatus Eremiobacteraeota bacterium]
MFNVQRVRRSHLAAAAIAATFVATACSAQGGSSVPVTGAQSPQTKSAARFTSNGSVLKGLTQQVVIGSTVDPVNGSQNPYGLTIAPSTNGKFTAGDLVVCNFNSKYNQQGSGKSIVALHPTPGSTPTNVSQNASILGCDALALGPDDTIWSAAMVANDNPILNSNGKLQFSITGKPFSQPWGQVFAQPATGSPAFFETNARTGTVVRINLGSNFTFDVIAKGFPRNRGVAGTALAPSGLAYSASNDTLYFADGKNNTVVSIANASTVPAGGITATHNGMVFTGPYASDAHVLYSGSPLNGPISTALLFNGNLVVGNTLDPAGTNLLIELSPSGQVLDTVNVDTGPGGAIFGIAATGTSSSDTKVYFNDDNQNNVQALEK